MGNGIMLDLIDVELKLTQYGMEFGEDDPLTLRKLAINGNYTIEPKMASDNSN